MGKPQGKLQNAMHSSRDLNIYRADAEIGFMSVLIRGTWTNNPVGSMCTFCGRVFGVSYRMSILNFFVC